MLTAAQCKDRLAQMKGTDADKLVALMRQVEALTNRSTRAEARLRKITEKAAELEKKVFADEMDVSVAGEQLIRFVTEGR